MSVFISTARCSKNSSRQISSGCTTKFCRRDFVLKYVVIGEKKRTREFSGSIQGHFGTSVVFFKICWKKLNRQKNILQQQQECFFFSDIQAWYVIALFALMSPKQRLFTLFFYFADVICNYFFKNQTLFCVILIQSQQRAVSQQYICRRGQFINNHRIV